MENLQVVHACSQLVLILVSGFVLLMGLKSRDIQGWAVDQYVRL